MNQTRVAATLLGIAALLAHEAQATSVTVVVHSPDGRPAANVVVELTPSSPAPKLIPAAPIVIAQRDLEFVPYVTAVPVGATVRFTNQDPYDHHLRSQPGGPLGNEPPARDFEMRLPAAKGDKVSSADVIFDKPGTVVLGCHLHSSMRGHLFVSAAAWAVVTDGDGVATFSGVPEGRAEFRTWSPEQLVPQAAGQAQLSGATAKLETTLNFTPSKPRRRRG